MMDVILGRRSVRRFDGREVGDETVCKILEAVMSAPSSKNVRSTRIAVSRRREVMEVVGEMRSTGSRFVKDAPVVFFVMGDAALSDLWRENCAISATILQLAAESLGLGSCWVHVDGRPHDEGDPGGMTAQEWLRERVEGLPGGYEILCVVAAGHAAEPAKRREPADDSDKIFWI